MNSTIITITAATALGIASFATANPAWDPDLDQTFLINDGDVFNPLQGNTYEFDFGVTSPNDVIGFSFSGVVSGISPFGAELIAEWTHLTLIAPTGESFTVGGLNSSSPFDAPWDFSTASNQNGLYQHGLGGDQWFGDGEPQFAFGDGVAAEGQWTASFYQTLGNGIGWEDVQITLHQAVPAPAGLALLLGFGLTARSRKR